MHVIAHSSNSNYRNALVISNANEIFPEPCENVLWDDVLAGARRPDHVQKIRNGGMRHGRHQSGGHSTRNQEYRPLGLEPLAHPLPRLIAMGYGNGAPLALLNSPSRSMLENKVLTKPAAPAASHNR